VVPITKRAKLAAALRWLVPSAVAAATGVTVSGALEGSGMETVFGAVAAAGFVVLVGWPILFAASAVVRGLWHAWRPGDLALVEADGSAPKLAAWIAVIWLALLGLAWTMFQGTWVLASATAFKPLSVSFGEPLLALGAALVLLAFSRPAARLLTWYYRKVDTLWRKRFTRSPITPRLIAIGTIVKSFVVGYLIWRWLVKPRVGPLDLSFVYVPLVAMLATCAMHALWDRLRRPRRIIGPVLGAFTAAAIAIAAFAWQARPALTLAIWGERPLAGFAIDKLLDLDSIRARMSLTEFRPVASPGSPHPDIVLITIDTVRADHTPPYGGHAEMPLLRELAARGVVFDWAFAPSNVTRRSIPSMVTGLSPTRVRGRVVGWALRIDPRHVLLAERLLAGGYETAGFVCCNGFWGPDFRTGLQRGLETLVIEPNGMKLAKQARTWLAERDKRRPGKPLFLWMHLLEPHNWQSGGIPNSEEEKRRFYDRALTASDAMAVELLAAFSQRPPEQAPIVIMSADHGEGLGDHGQPYHSTDLYNSQIHVPFVIAGPGIRVGRVSETVSLTDLTPTVLELAGFVPPRGNSMDGRSLADLATGKRGSEDNGGVAFAAMIKDRSNPGGITAVIQGPWKLIEGPTFELYNLQQDPNERSNVVTTRVPKYDELRKLLLKYKDAAKRSPFE
jgi:arylsulfatase A-like enzyme